MTRIRIDCFDCSVFVYRADEKSKFEKAYNTDVGKNYGQVTGNGVWIGEHEDIVGVCYHEAVHLADWVIEERLGMEQGSLSGNCELRAYLTEWIGNRVRKYVTGE